MYNNKVCIIHYESDKNIAENLEYALNKYGISVWREDQIELGSRTSEEINKAIDSARIVIVLWSTNSVKSALLKEQAERAKKRTALIPVLIDNVKLPSESVGTQAANLVGWNGEEDNKEFIKLRQLIQEPRLLDLVTKRLSTANWNTIASIAGVIVAASGVIVTALSNEYVRCYLGLEKCSSPVPSYRPSYDDNPQVNLLDNDYTELSRLLKEKKWREADIKTRGIMHKIAHVKAEGKEDGPALKTDDIQKFPCEHLKKIDELWAQHSDGLYGFSKQKSIILKVVGNNKEIMKHFNDDTIFKSKVAAPLGWLDKNGEYLDEKNTLFTTNMTTPGHLPTWFWAINNSGDSTRSIPKKLQACEF
jgi:hypothetical protein